MLLLITFGDNLVSPALIMLSGIYYGAQYGGSHRHPRQPAGEMSLAVTCLDAPDGSERRNGAFLATAAISSFVAGCIGTLPIVPLGTRLRGPGAPNAERPSRERRTEQHDQQRADAAGNEGRNRSRGESCPGPAVPSHLVAVETCHGRRRFARQVDEDGGVEPPYWAP